MENKKEPLMSAEEFLHKIYFEKRENVKPGQFYPEPPTTEKIEDCKAYAKYVLNNAKEFVADDVKYNHTCNDGKGCGIPYCNSLCGNIDKQSIHTAIDNYIEINLNK